MRPAGPYVIQGAVAALHALARRAEDTDWRQIAALYDRLIEIMPSPVVELNRAVAIAMSRGYEEGLVFLDELERSGELDGYHLLFAARADLLRRLLRPAEAVAAYDGALELNPGDRERRYLLRRRAQVEAEAGH
jgi:RNA polymerase sigma-70 factor (ECF subfamily)